MLLQKKARYNLIQLNLPQIESGELHMGDLQGWQKQNYRDKSTEVLFHEITTLGIPLTIDKLQTYTERYEDPEELVEALAKGRSDLEKDQIYLIVFELWRRLFPERRTLSIFCDELDFQMIAHDLQKESHISDSLAYLEQILDEQVDQGVEPHTALELVQMYCANDIESFLFDYTLEQIDADNHTYAAELLEGFKRYVRKAAWFDYLEARTTILTDPEQGYEALEQLITTLPSDTPIELCEEILFFLAGTGNHTLFHTLALKILPWITLEVDFKEFLQACYSHYDYLELPKIAKPIAKLFHSRSETPGDKPLLPSDKGVQQIFTLLSQKVHFAEE